MVRRGWLDLFRSSLASDVPWEQIPEDHGQLLEAASIGKPSKTGCTAAQLLKGPQACFSPCGVWEVQSLEVQTWAGTFLSILPAIFCTASPCSRVEHQGFLRRYDGTSWWSQLAGNVTLEPLITIPLKSPHSLPWPSSSPQVLGSTKNCPQPEARILPC